MILKKPTLAPQATTLPSLHGLEASERTENETLAVLTR